MTPPPPSTIQETYDLALQAHQAGRVDEAAAGYRTILARQSDHPDALNNLALIEQDRGDLAAAAALSRAAVAALDHPSLLQNLGVILAESGDTAGAEAAYIHGLEIDPVHPEILNNLMTLYVDQERFEAAEICNQRLIRAMPDQAQLHANLGGFAHIRQKFDLATHHYRQALTLDPNNLDARLNLASLYIEIARPDLSEIEARLALQLKPQDPRAELALGHALLGQGRWTEGWPHYDHRLTAWKPEPDFQVPQWRGEPLRGKSLVMVGEQGLGDNIQFARYGGLLKANGARRVVLATAGELVRLLGCAAGLDQAVGTIGEAGPVDYWAPLMSLPGLLGTTRDEVSNTLPEGLPYIRLPPLKGADAPDDSGPLRVGIFWAGGHETAPTLTTRADTQRSLSLDQILSLLLAPDLADAVQWTILQRDRRPDYLSALAQRAGWRDPFGDPDFVGRADLYDTGQIMKDLDLVIGVDSAQIHLSAALGRPTWMLDRLAHCWRWRPGASDSDWYPGVFRIFRQTRFGDWLGVLTAVRAALIAHAEAARSNLNKPQMTP